MLDTFDDFRRRHPRIVLMIGLLALLVVTRMGHLAGPIDEPHAWRQSDTAQYALAFFQSGIDLLHPSVNWMGNYKTVAFEYPLPEALMALVWRVFGYDLLYARLVVLMFFAGSAAYLYLIVRRFATEGFAALATAVYLVLPLSLYYSRAVHVDFAAVFLAHAMCFHILRLLDGIRVRDLILGASAATLAFLIKAPYAFYFALPLGIVFLQQRNWRAAAWAAACTVPALAAFAWWESYSAALNGAAPDWSFIPGYQKIINMGSWYFGQPGMRTDPATWWRLLDRFRHEVASPVGFWLALAGAIATFGRPLRKHRAALLVLWVWLVGAGIYVAIFINLNFVHDYYQMPLLAVTSVFIALGIATPQWYLSEKRANQASAILAVLVAASGIIYANKHDYKPDNNREEAGQFIASHSPVGVPIVAATDIDYTDCRDPRFLFRASRYGWSLAVKDLKPEVLHGLYDQGARQVFLLQERTTPLPDGLTGAISRHLLADGVHELRIVELTTR